MLTRIPNVLDATHLSAAREILDKALWIDGKVTAGPQAAKAKDNMQIPADDPTARQLGETVLRALGANPLFITAALPHRIFPPLFNRYSGGQSFGTHVDNAIRQVPGTPHRIRTDISATLFLSAPEEYDGGELCIEDNYGVHKVKLPAGHLVLYPATSLHHVTPVTRGARICSFFWIQSMVRSDAQRSMLFDLDMAIQRLDRELGKNPAAARIAVQLTGVYHNLLREWTEL
jgi:PKHD-type hydroxylase